jgi:hypothetical protein
MDRPDEACRGGLAQAAARSRSESRLRHPSERMASEVAARKHGGRALKGGCGGWQTPRVDIVAVDVESSLFVSGETAQDGSFTRTITRPRK